MNTKHILILSAASVLLSSANATVLFTEDFEDYALGSQINGQGGWTADSSYTIETSSFTGTKAVESDNATANATLFNSFTAQAAGTTLYFGVDVDYRVGSANTYFMNLSDDGDLANSAGANFGASGGVPTVGARNFFQAASSNDDGNPPARVEYGDPARIVITLSSSGANGVGVYDTTTIWSSSTNSIISSYTHTTGVDVLDTFIGSRGGDTSGNSFVMDNIVIATTFSEAATIPEPSTFALLAGFCGLASIALRRRRL